MRMRRYFAEILAAFIAMLLFFRLIFWISSFGYGAHVDTLGSIRVRVMDASTRVPLKTTRVGVSDAQGGEFGMLVDKEGVSVHKIPPGVWSLAISAKDHERYRRSVQLQPGQHVDLGEVVLSKALNVSGSVLGIDGKPTSASIQWDALDHSSGPQRSRGNLSTPSNAEGKFTIPSLGRRRYVVRAFERGQLLGGVAHLLVDMRRDVPQSLRIQLVKTRPVQIQNQVSDSESRLLWIETKDGVPALAIPIFHGPDLTTRLPAGDYQVWIYQGTQVVHQVLLRVTEQGGKLRVPN